MKWIELDQEVYIKLLEDGYDIMQIVWLDTCPHDSSKEYCVCRAKIDDTTEKVNDAVDAICYFQEYCLYDSYCIKEECSHEEAIRFVEDTIQKEAM